MTSLFETQSWHFFFEAGGTTKEVVLLLRTPGRLGAVLRGDLPSRSWELWEGLLTVWMNRKMGPRPQHVALWAPTGSSDYSDRMRAGASWASSHPPRAGVAGAWLETWLGISFPPSLPWPGSQWREEVRRPVCLGTPREPNYLLETVRDAFLAASVRANQRHGWAQIWFWSVPTKQTAY